jgi:hypothetical protein
VKNTEFPSDALTDWVRQDPYALRDVFVRMTTAAPDLVLRMVTERGNAPDELIAYLEERAS